MRPCKPGIVRSLALFVVLALGASACDSNDKSTPDAKDAPPGVTLNGSGGTFPKGFYDSVIAGYGAVDPGVTVNYSGVGAGKGRQDLADGVADFAGTDNLVKEEDKAKYKGGELVYVPTVVAPIALAYNLGGIDDLSLDAGTIARIFQREVTTWDDAAIQALNPGATLPADAITVARRSDSSSTSENFAKYLAAAAPDAFTIVPDALPAWPEGTKAGLGAAGVIQIVADTPGAITYLDLPDAKDSGLRLAAVRNRAGQAVKPSPAGASAVAGVVEVQPDLTYDPLNAEGDAAYPITAPTWIVVYKSQTDKARGGALKAFLAYLLTDGQKLAEAKGYGPLPPSLAEKAVAQVKAITVAG